ncbi:hypothetical protein C0V77_04560 [Emticicia sp. TH156]|nr:hypothetical protein C0V77_04560 [Emticicia sp. TH156]
MNIITLRIFPIYTLKLLDHCLLPAGKRQKHSQTEKYILQKVTIKLKIEQRKMNFWVFTPE